jgi:hypothetical protein
MAFIDHVYKLASRKPTMLQRFYDRIPWGANDECWVWPGIKTEDGYGRFGRWRAHCIVWELNSQQPVPKGMQVCHRCDNPSCCNPTHLFLGTHQDNIDDKMRKGRYVPPTGARPDKSAEVHALRAKGLTVEEVAKELGIGTKAVYRDLRNGRLRQ